jgi:hypothetical protein
VRGGEELGESSIQTGVARVDKFFRPAFGLAFTRKTTVPEWIAAQTGHCGSCFAFAPFAFDKRAFTA